MDFCKNLKHNDLQRKCYNEEDYKQTPVQLRDLSANPARANKGPQRIRR